MKSILSHRVVGLALILNLLALQAFLISCRSRVESDVRLSRLLDENASDFNQILEMLSQDRHIQRIDFDFVTLDTGAFWKQGDPDFSQKRWEEYRVLFRKIGLQNGIGRQNGDSPVVFFYAMCRGSAITRDCKGYAYSEKALLPTKNDLDHEAPGVTYKRLSDGWYLFRDGG